MLEEDDPVSSKHQGERKGVGGGVCSAVLFGQE